MYHLQPPWQLTIVSKLFLRFLGAYNAAIISSNTTSGVTTFEVTDPRFVIKRKEDNVISIMFVADALNNPAKVSLHTRSLNDH
jgi:hypothetical protein